MYFIESAPFVSTGTSGKDVESEKGNQTDDSHYRRNSIKNYSCMELERRHDDTFLCISHFS